MSDQDSESETPEPPSPETPSPEPPSPDPAASPPESPESETPKPNTGSHVVRSADSIDRPAIAKFVTTIKNAEQQVGEHVIGALQHPNTVAVLTTVALAPDGQQRVISAALNPERMQQVQEILNAAELEREQEEPCVGFHCLVKPKPAPEVSQGEAST